MRKLNVERMRRYPARTTPDQIERVFTEREIMNNEFLVLNWVEEFRLKMIAKHGEGVVDVWVDQMRPLSAGLHGDVKAYARVRLEEKRRR